MAKISTGSTFGLNAKQTAACRLLAQGNTEEEIMGLFFGIGENSTYGEKQKARKTLHRWMRLPEFQECYKAIVKEIAFGSVGAATARLIKQVNDENGWLANKASNDVLNRFAPMIMGEEDKQLVVKVVGAPEIGAPTAEE